MGCLKSADAGAIGTGVSRVTIWKRIKKYNVDLVADLDRNTGE